MASRGPQWANLPLELLLLILSKNNAHFKSLLAVSGVCREWRRCSEHVSSIIFGDTSCKKHGTLQDSTCACVVHCVESFISRSHSATVIELFEIPEAARILERCNYWSFWSSSLTRLGLAFPPEAPSPELCKLISSCRGIQVLDIKNLGSAGSALSPAALGGLRELLLSGTLPDEESLNKILKSCTSLTELWIHSVEDVSSDRFSLCVPPKVEVLDVILGVAELRVQAPSVHTMAVGYSDCVFVEGAGKLRELTLRFNSILKQAPQTLEKLVLHRCDVQGLLCVFYFPNLKSLKVTSRLDYWPSDRDSETVSGFLLLLISLRLPLLEELEMNFDTMIQLRPMEVELKLPKLKRFVLDMATTELSNYASSEEERNLSESQKRALDLRFMLPLLQLLVKLPRVEARLRNVGRAPSHLCKLFKHTPELLTRFPSAAKELAGY